MRIEEDKSSEGLALIEELKETISKESSALLQIKKLYGIKNVGDGKLISAQIKDLTLNLSKLNKRISEILFELDSRKKFNEKFLGIERGLRIFKGKSNIKIDSLEKETLKRLKKGSKKEKEKVVKKNGYSIFANKIFSVRSKRLVEKGYFNSLERDIKNSNLRYPLEGYVSMILLTTIISFFVGVFSYLFFLFFSIEATAPIVSIAEDLGSRALKFLWMIIVFPIIGFFMAHSYPSLEKKSAEASIDYELPFATINMAAIAGSMINPVKMFEIIINSKEFPNVERELTKLMNHINVYGYGLVNALRSTSENTPSKKMRQLFNGLATTIHSGGDLRGFFDSRAETLLFEYRLNREKETKTAETFMDLYISIVIAAPMIFMLLLMMIKISGLGISLPTSTLTLIMVSGVAMINAFFIMFLHLKKKG